MKYRQIGEHVRKERRSFRRGDAPLPLGPSDGVGHLGGEHAEVRSTTGVATPLSGPDNPAGDLMNSTADGMSRTPADVNTFGYDADEFDIHDAVSPGDTGLTLTFSTLDDGFQIGQVFGRHGVSFDGIHNCIVRPRPNAVNAKLVVSSSASAARQRPGHASCNSARRQTCGPRRVLVTSYLMQIRRGE